MLLRILIFWVAIISSNKINATDWAPLSDVRLVQSSDLIVQGEIFKKDDVFYIDVDSVLKGKNTDKIKLKTPDAWMLGIVLIEKQKGIFCLTEIFNKASYGFFHPYCVKENKELKNIEKAIDIWRYTKKYVDDFDKESSDVNYVLGQLFSGWRVNSKEADFFAKSLNNYHIKIFEEAPWEENYVITLTIRVDSNRICSIASSNPKSKLSKVFEKRVQIACEWDYNKEKLPSQFSITIDNSKTNISDISYEQATTYLVDKLDSKESDIVVSAIQALSIIGDTACISKLIKLVRASNPQVSEMAVKALGWSKSTISIDTIGLFLVENCKLDIRLQSIPNTAAQALRNINQSDCIPYLETASKYGIESAINALGCIGRRESLDTLIAAIINNPNKCYNAVNALYWLVRRSNYEIEEWMKRPNPDDGHKMKERIPLWINWSKTIKDDFIMIRTFDEAVKQKISAWRTH